MRTAASCLAWLLAGGCAVPHTNDGTAEPTDPTRTSSLTLDRILSRPGMTGASPSAPTWSPDSSRLAFRWASENGSQREIWLVEGDGTGRRQLTRESNNRASVREFVWLPDSTGLVYLRSRELWRIDVDGRAARLTTLEGGGSHLRVSPDGHRVSVLQDGDLWLFDMRAKRLERATAVGVPSISNLPLGRYRRPDVEIGSYVWGGPIYAWSPDSSTIAVHYVDRRGVRTVPFPNYLGKETEPNLVRRGYPGDANELRTIGLLAVDSGELELLELPTPTAVRVANFAWSSDGRLLIDRESDTAVDRWLHVFDPTTEQLEELWHDHRETRVYTTVGSAWHPDGKHVVVLGDLDDRYGLYALGPGIASPRRLTNPSFDVAGAPRITDSGAIYYASNEPHPHENHVHKTTLAGQPSRRLTTRPGHTRPYPSPNGKRLALLHSDDVTPTELFLMNGTQDGGEQRITTSQPPEFTRQNWVAPHYVTFPSQIDDATLHARILEPANLDRTRKHPVVFGPVYSNTVRNRWAGFYGLFQQLLVSKGYIVVQVDVRGSTGYGRAFREDFLMDFAGKDLEDLESAVTYLETLPHVDPDRIGIWGSSYGGTLTAYALLKKPGLFDAGVACAAAVDPYFFGNDDVAIVRRPATHPEAFLRGAAQYAANLQDPLLLIHGMQDQIVPFKTVVALAEELMRQQKDFDFAFAPGGTHAWTSRSHYARYLLGKLLTHFDRHL